MADQASSTITIDAPVDRVLAVIADIPAYPRWTPQITTAEVVETGPDGRPHQARFNLDAGALRDTYTLEYDWSADGVSWRLVGRSTVQKSQQGSYRCVAVGEGTEVTYSLAVDIAIPMLGVLKRRAEKMIMDSALKELKKYVESGA